MAETLTANYGWTKPDPGASANTWGATLNSDLDKIDAQVFLNQQAGVPVGSGAIWFTNTPPANWLICNGQSLATTGTYAALFAVIGYTYGGAGANFNLPPVAGRFLFGVGAGVALAATGGASTVTLATANLPAHAHPITDVGHTHAASQPAHTHGDPGHTHGVNDPGHAHGGVVKPVGPTLYPGVPTGMSMQPGSTDPAGTGISIQAAATGLQAAQPAITVVASGTGLSTTQNAGGGQAVPTMPPFLGINFIIKYQ